MRICGHNMHGGSWHTVENYLHYAQCVLPKESLQGSGYAGPHDGDSEVGMISEDVPTNTQVCVWSAFCRSRAWQPVASGFSNNCRS